MKKEDSPLKKGAKIAAGIIVGSALGTVAARTLIRRGKPGFGTSMPGPSVAKAEQSFNTTKHNIDQLKPKLDQKLAIKTSKTRTFLRQMKGGDRINIRRKTPKISVPGQTRKATIFRPGNGPIERPVGRMKFCLADFD